MPPYATARQGILVVHTNDDVHSVEPIHKRYLPQIDERFVRFQDNVIVHECPQHHQTEQSQEQFNTKWYSAKELVRCRQEANRQARQFQRRCRPLPRGLELQTTQGIQRCLKNRLCAMAVVLEIQYAAHDQEQMVTASNSTDNYNHHHVMEHLYPETDSSEMIAKAYREVTRHCRVEAMEVGLRDQMESLESENREGEEDLQCHPSGACLNMPPWLSAMLKKRAGQQPEQRILFL
mmetsp:Transcript_26783/g.65130  ORF Transcript_26783/g.65130 Transcript_26783/m.65130 type:complete len:235 (+) Transcript_26783:228-932(+)